MSKFLLDANLSPETATYLREVHRLDTSDAVSLGIARHPDRLIVERAQKESRVVITFDRDIGEIFYRGEMGPFGVILLRLDDQTVEAVNALLDRFFRQSAASINLDRSLVVIDEQRMRVVPFDR